MDGSKAEGDLVLIQTFLLYCASQVILMLTSIFQEQFPLQSKEGLYQNKVTLSLASIRNCKIGLLLHFTMSDGVSFSTKCYLKSPCAFQVIKSNITVCTG